MTRYGLFAALGIALVAALALLLMRSDERGGARATSREQVRSLAGELEDLDVGRIEQSTPTVPAERTPAAPEAPAPAAAPCSLVLTILDPQRVPLAGARVRFEMGERSDDRVTDALGTCAWDPPDAGGANVLVERDGYAHRRLRNVSRSLTLVLNPAARLEGRVLDAATGEPVSGAVVEREHGGCAGCAPDRVVSDDAGHYALADVPSVAPDQPLAFFVRANGYAGKRFEFVLWQAAPRIERDFELEPRPDLHGSVVNLVTGAPIAGARLELGIDVLETDGAGHFSTDTTVLLDGPPARRASPRHLSVRAPGFGVLSIESVNLESPLFLRLPPTASVSGRVLANGAPVAAVLALSNRWSFSERDLGGTPYASLPDAWHFSDALRDAHADAAGRYRIDGLLPWCAAHLLWVQSDGFPAKELELPALVPGQTLEFDVELEPDARGTLHGDLVFNGRPARGSIAWRIGEEHQGESGGIEAEDGRYRIEHVPAGRVVLEARPLGIPVDSLVPAARAEVDLAAGEELRHDFRIELPLSAITGHVTYEDGAPATDVEVNASGWQGWRPRDRSGADGSYRLVVPAGAGPFVVTAKQESAKASREDVAPGERDVDLALPRLGRLLLRAVDRDTRAPVVPMYVSWRSAGHGEYEPLQGGRTDEQGFWLAHLPAGSVDLAVHAGNTGYAPDLRLAMPVRASGEPERITFELTRGVEVAFRLEPGPLPGSPWVVLAPAELWSALTCTRNDQGNNKLSFGGAAPATGLQGLFYTRAETWSLRGLAPGRYRFKVFHEDLELEPAELELYESPAAPIVVRWRRR